MIQHLTSPAILILYDSRSPQPLYLTPVPPPQFPKCPLRGGGGGLGRGAVPSVVENPQMIGLAQDLSCRHPFPLKSPSLSLRLIQDIPSISFIWNSVSLCGTGDRTRGLDHARPALSTETHSNLSCGKRTVQNPAPSSGSESHLSHT